METEISLERAVSLIRSYVSTVGTEMVQACKAFGRVLAEDLRAPISQPPWPRSPLDGFALRSEDSKNAGKEMPVTLRIMETIYAGDWSDRIIGPGEAVRIMTGAPVPKGCDCVIAQEETVSDGDTVRIERALHHRENYCAAGEDFRAGEVILAAGTRLSGYAWGLLSAAGLCRADEMLRVYRPVRCFLIPTGDELVSNDIRPLPKGKIYSANEAYLSARLRKLDITPENSCGASGDDPEKLAEIIRKALEQADVVLTTGGVSVGAKDILPESLTILGAETVFRKVMLKPGAPLMFSVWKGKPVLSLSGNPFAASATFELFARPLLASLTGTEDLLPLVLPAVLDTAFPKFGEKRRFVRATFHDGHVTMPEDHSSGQLASAVGTNCLAEFPPSDRPFLPGDTVRVYLL